MSRRCVVGAVAVVALALVGVVHAHADAAHEHSSSSSSSSSSSPPPPTFSLYVEALLSTAFICVVPVFVLPLLPVGAAAADRRSSDRLLKVLLGFAVGGLLGDVFLHLLPHAISPHDHAHDHAAADDDDHHHHHHPAHEHDHSAGLAVGLSVLAGMLFFFVVEKYVNIRHASLAATATKASSSSSSSQRTTRADSKRGATSSTFDFSDVKPAGWLNLAADFTHNFTDGLAIGASFLHSRSLGASTTLAVFFHEIPHEIGDFAILVQSGFSRRAAMLLQFSTAIGAVLGTLVGLALHGDTHGAARWVLPFTGGGFIYIATVSVLPELLRDTDAWQSIKEVAAMCVGVGAMYLIALYE